MLFSSVSFLFYFFTLLLSAYFLVTKKYRAARNGVLLLFSLAFYAFGGVRYLFFMLLEIALSYVAGLMCDSKKRHVKNIGLIFALITGLGMLA